jgi:hypothetical protein
LFADIDISASPARSNMIESLLIGLVLFLPYLGALPLPLAMARAHPDASPGS